jgi:DNA helicase-2/ATP-dependent DNA helicase PcrA
MAAMRPDRLSSVPLRPAQAAILKYRRGKMGISAVPGSGKTWTLSLLAARIVASGELADDQEVLVVTLVNSAVDNFYQRVGGFVEASGLLPNMGYRVRTLHGLAHDIVRARPALVGLEERFQIVDEREAESIRLEAARAWLRSHPDDLEDYLNPELEEGQRDRARRQALPELVGSMAQSLIRVAKDRRLTPERLRQRLDELPVPLPLAEMGWQIFDDYQQALAYRGSVDFDDLIRLAIQALEADPAYLERLRYQWPYILEDEAQDSSRLQEEILQTLAGPDGNWVRVGDPNQAIFETFTTASPRYLREFLQRRDVISHTLPNSGRSTPSIINLANRLVAWTMQEHPQDGARNALLAPPEIEPAPPGDPRPNPADEPDKIYLLRRQYAPMEEIEAVANSLARWLPDHADQTVAVLAPRNERGRKLVDELHRRGIPFDDSLLGSSRSTRDSANVIATVLRHLSDPLSPGKLAELYEIWRRADQDEAQAKKAVKQVAELLRKITRVEDYLWPGAEHDWLADLEAAGVVEHLLDSLEQFRRLARRWNNAALLPIDQLVLTLAQDLLTQPAELALAQKLAVLLRQASQIHPGWRLPELNGELLAIVANERRFLGFSGDETGFDPDQHPGKVVVSTMHRAKGLEWDKVYLMSVNNYDFPAAGPGDTFIAEKWFLRGQLNLEAEALAQLQAALEVDEYAWYEEGQATLDARLDYARERLRLLYVGITRARRELVVTWNSGKDGDCWPAIALVALQNYWEEGQNGGRLE